MKKTTHNQQKPQQDVLERIDQWLNVLDEQTTALLSNIDIESVTFVQRSQAAYRLFRLMFRVLKLRQDYAQSGDPKKYALIRKLILEGEDKITKAMRQAGASELIRKLILEGEDKSEGVPTHDNLEDPVD
jgi:hypothetical protein